jgi:hypothetical protein
LKYTQAVLDIIGMPRNRFVFCDVWYVPIEKHTSTVELIKMLKAAGFQYEKIISENLFDLDRALAQGIKGAQEAWGDGEHRYLLAKA